MSRIGGFIAFLIYMITTFALYVPDWSFVLYHQHKAERHIVCPTSKYCLVKKTSGDYH